MKERKFLNRLRMGSHSRSYLTDEQRSITEKELKNLFLAYMEANKFTFSPRELFEPVDYILQLGGKRLRPVLLLGSYNLYQEEVNPALPAAYAYEIFHNFSLVHDDIMDEAPLRRGKATIHKKYDINTGILSGDVMLIYAYKYLIELEKKEVIPEMLSIFTKVSTEVCIGQQYDINFETAKQVTIEEYLQMIESKTAALIAGAMYSGALLATYLVLAALERANNNQREQLEKLLSSRPIEEEEKIKVVTQLFNDLNIKELANQKKDAYHLKALKNLDALDIDAKKLLPLKTLAESLLQRVQ